FAVTASVAAENNHDCSVVIARTPNPVGLMIANRFRQTEPRPEVIDRARFAEVVRENGGARLFFWRERYLDALWLFGHFAPAKLVREILRERSGALVFGFWRLETELLLVDNSLLRRKNRRHCRRENDCREQDQNSINRAAPFPLRAANFFKSNCACREQG